MTDAQTALAAAQSAAASSSTAADAATGAAESVATALTHRTAAEAARTGAETAKTAAETARDTATANANGFGPGTATALAPGAAPTVTITGTAPTRVINLGIPAGLADDASLTAVDADAGSAFRVQQDARLATTFAKKVGGVLQSAALTNGTNQAAVIQAEMNSLSTLGGGGVVLPVGVVTVAEQGTSFYCLSIPANVHLQGSSRGKSVVKMAAGQRTSVRTLYAESVDGITVSDLTVDGNKANQSGHTLYDEKMHGLMVRACTNVTVKSVKFLNCYGDGAWVGDLAFVPSQQVTFRDCYVDGSSRNGITFAGGGTARGTRDQLVDGGRILNCTFRNVTVQPIDCEPVNGVIDNILIDGNDIGSSTTGDYALTIAGGSAGSAINASRNWRVTNNTIKGSTFVYTADDVTFSDNYIDTTGNASRLNGIEARYNNKRLRVARNNITVGGTPSSGALQEAAIYIIENNTNVTDAADVLDNTINVSGGFRGVQMHSVTRGRVIGNRIKSDGTAVGIYCKSTRLVDSCEVRNNTVTNTVTGVLIAYSLASGYFTRLAVTGNSFLDDQGTPTLVKGIEFFTNDHAALHLEMHGNYAHPACTSPISGISSAGTVYMIAGNMGGVSQTVSSNVTGTLVPGIYSVGATPEAVVSAPVGSIAFNRNGGTSTAIYYKASGTGNTGWVTVGGTPTALTANLADITHAINTTGKYTGKIVLNLDTHKLVSANGSTAGSTWYDASGALAHTPV